MTKYVAKSTSPRKSELHEIALQWAGAGWRVFPCLDGGKAPAIANGFHAATTDPAQIESWWQSGDFNVGLVCDLNTVIDVEADGLARLMAFQQEYGAIPPTFTVRTPSGGKHYYLSGIAPRRIRPFKGYQIDVCGEGGYVLAPGSVTDAGCYAVEHDADFADMPAWLPARLPPRAEKRATPPGFVLDEPGNVERARSHLARCVEHGKVAVAGQGGNDLTYQVACELFELGCSPAKAAELMADWNEHCVPPWRSEELSAIVSHAAAYADNEPGCWAVAPASEAFKHVALTETPPVAKRSRFYPHDEVAMDNQPPVEWLIPNVLMDKCSHFLVAETQSYKSFYALDLALSIASGEPHAGIRPAKTGHTLYCALEGLRGIEKERRLAWRIAHGIDGKLPFYAMPAPQLSDRAGCDEYVTEIAAHCDRVGSTPLLVVLDTQAKVMEGMDESGTKEAGLMVGFTDLIKRTFNCAVVVVHHKSDKEGSADYRGNSSFRAGYDCMISLKANRAARTLAATIEKFKDAPEPEKPYTFEAKDVAGSLVLQPTTAAQHVERARGVDIYHRKNVGGALKRLGQPVPTHVLAAELLGPPADTETADDTERRLKSAVSRLNHLANPKEARTLTAYVVSEPVGRNPRMWGLPPTLANQSDF